nr:glycosyltransferase [Jeotgalibacillus malaysiensis]
MKKKLFFTIDSLACAGAEKSLITLLNKIDYSRFEVDLLLFSRGGELEPLIPKEVNVMKQLNYFLKAGTPIIQSIKEVKNKEDLLHLRSRISYSLKMRVFQGGNIKKARLFWNSSSSTIEQINNEYDIAIAYAQGAPTFFVVDKVIARKKIVWVNAIYELESKEKVFQKPFYDSVDAIVTVSDAAMNAFMQNYPEYKNKIKVIYDLIDAEIINTMADKEIMLAKKNEITILTIGRLSKLKGFDLAIDACEILMKKGHNFKWYVLGKGPLKLEIEEVILRKGLKDHFVLLGVDPNPYPYIKKADIYVQTSRDEGFGLAIAEARMLNTPVVSTNFQTAYDQIIDRHNGLISKMNGADIADKISLLIEDPILRNTIINNLKKEKKGNAEELIKIYDLIAE